MFIERPLATLPVDHAERFVRAMFAPDQQLARACHDRFRAAGHDHPTATLETRIELHTRATRLIANLADPALHTVGFQKVAAHWQDAGGVAAYRPIGLFGYRALEDHLLGVELAERLARTGILVGALGIAHDLGILDGHAGLDVRKTILLSIAHKAERAGHARLLVVVDRSLREPCARFGIEFPDELQLATPGGEIGIFDLAANRARVDAIESQHATPFAWAA